LIYKFLTVKGSFFLYIAAKHTILKKTVLILILFVQAAIAFSQVRVPRFVTDGMVLQRGEPIRIWGWASPGEEIAVNMDGKKSKTVTGMCWWVMSGFVPVSRICN
jgi:hypothetical protein